MYKFNICYKFILVFAVPLIIAPGLGLAAEFAFKAVLDNTFQTALWAGECEGWWLKLTCVSAGMQALWGVSELAS